MNRGLRANSQPGEQPDAGGPGDAPADPGQQRGAEAAGQRLEQEHGQEPVPEERVHPGQKPRVERRPQHGRVAGDKAEAVALAQVLGQLVVGELVPPAQAVPPRGENVAEAHCDRHEAEQPEGAGRPSLRRFAFL